MGSLDIIGRLGGEEFGVFLPASNAEQAQRTAETIRQSVQMIEFDAAGTKACVLSVSIGGTVAAEPVDFGVIFKSADEQLYKVKESGRNGVSLVVLLPRPTATMAIKEPTGLVYRGQEVKRIA